MQLRDYKSHRFLLCRHQLRRCPLPMKPLSVAPLYQLYIRSNYISND
jgi:hypothetical protein